jgi:alanyl-tRNA synthetase
MTVRLYYADSFLREFDAKVLSAEPAGDLWHVLLDGTAFYPTSGGQPHDTGRLGDAAVVDVTERPDGQVVHVTDRRPDSSSSPGASVHGRIDWPRRFDHMQQHSGQHLLSAVFIELFAMQTVSFHLGRELSTIDLAGPELSHARTEEAERRTNELVFEDRPVSVSLRTREEVAALGVRKQVDREGDLRIVEIAGCDRQPCGGTHVARTGQIGLVLLRAYEKVRQNWRLEFVAGERARRTARQDLETLSHAARQLTCGISELPDSVARVLSARQEAQAERQRLSDELADAQARLLLREAAVEGRRVIRCVFENADPNFLRRIANQLVEAPGMMVVIGSRRGGHIVFAQSARGEADMPALLRACLAEAGGKGGGKRDFAQGSVPDASRIDAVLDRAAQHLLQMGKELREKS